jgi:protein-S-isoprenylcysteine O-methyltransferase Ste14
MQRGTFGFQPSTDHPNVVASPAVIFAAVLALGFILDWGWPAAFLPVSWSFVLGFFIIFIAGNIMTYAARELVRIDTNIKVRKPARDLATEGAYSVSRNPMYAGILVLNIGIACFANSLWILLLTILLMALLQKGVIEPEEAYLEKKFGGKYLRYKAKVRRWI